MHVCVFEMKLIHTESELSKCVIREMCGLIISKQFIFKKNSDECQSI
jgi:hypothetical protein